MRPGGVARAGAVASIGATFVIAMISFGALADVVGIGNVSHRRLHHSGVPSPHAGMTPSGRRGAVRS